jgi:hypothetical protein
VSAVMVSFADSLGIFQSDCASRAVFSKVFFLAFQLSATIYCTLILFVGVARAGIQVSQIVLHKRLQNSSASLSS